MAENNGNDCCWANSVFFWYLSTKTLPLICVRRNTAAWRSVTCKYLALSGLPPLTREYSPSVSRVSHSRNVLGGCCKAVVPLVPGAARRFPLLFDATGTPVTSAPRRRVVTSRPRPTTRSSPARVFSAPAQSSLHGLYDPISPRELVGCTIAHLPRWPVESRTADRYLIILSIWTDRSHRVPLLPVRFSLHKKVVNVISGTIKVRFSLRYNLLQFA